MTKDQHWPPEQPQQPQTWYPPNQGWPLSQPPYIPSNPQFQLPPQQSHGQQPPYGLSQQTPYINNPSYQVPPQQPLQWLPQFYQPNPVMPPPKRGGLRKKIGPIPLWIWIFILILMIVIPIAAIASVQNKSIAETTSLKASSTALIGSTVGETIYTFYSPFSSLKWSPDGSTLQVVRKNGTVQIWNTTSWDNLVTFAIPSNVLTAVAWSPQGDYFATVSLMDPITGAVRVWNTATGENVLTYLGSTSEVIALAWSLDGKYIASAGSTGNDSTVQIWDAATGKTLLTYRGHTGGVNFLAWSPDGQRIASAGNDNTVQVWNAFTGNRIVTYYGHPNGAWRVAWSPDGTRIASGDDISLKDFKSGKKVATTVQVWDAATGRRIVTYHGHVGIVYALMWSPDGQRIASAGNDSTVQIWDAATGKTLFTYRKHKSGVGDLSWSPNGKYIASADIWNVLIWQTV